MDNYLICIQFNYIFPYMFKIYIQLVFILYKLYSYNYIQKLIYIEYTIEYTIYINIYKINLM